MQAHRFGWLAVGFMMVTPVLAQWESGSDGTDGAFFSVFSVEVDLGLAASLCDCDGGGQLNDPCRWDCPSPVAGRGVYDAEQFVIVYKYSWIEVTGINDSFSTVTFKNHPSGAPVVWLATENVTISGTVNLDGKTGVLGAPIPTFPQPGPGGYEGGQSDHAGAGTGTTNYSRGFGPGSLLDGSYAAHAYANFGGATYGSIEAQPLTGGSGGGGVAGAGNSGGGAGGGAILIASNTSIVVHAVGQIRAEGGASTSFAGSGGDIRLRAETITLDNGYFIDTNGGYSNGGNYASSGHVRIEAFTLTNNTPNIIGLFSATNTPSVVFVTTPPHLRVVAMCGEFAPLEPIAGIMSTEVEFTSGSPCTIDIEAEGIPAGTTVGVRVIPARGPIVTATSTPLADVGGGLRTATATVTFPPGRSETQLRANW